MVDGRRGVTDVDGDQHSDRQPRRVLLLYYTYTGQSSKVLEAAGEVFRERGCDVYSAAIEFTDRRFAERFSRFPMRHVWPDLLSVLPAQTRHASGQIRTPDEVRNGDYDLICIGSPTWWRATNMPMRSFLTSDEARKLLCDKPFAVFVVCRRYWAENLKTVRHLGERQGGQYMGEVHFGYPGGQIRSLLSLTSYLGSGEYRDRYLGVRIPPTNVQPEQLEQTRAFAAALADRLFGKG
jgi:menaquinone-dependent protoporphyrinogen IX oxidase